MIVFFYAVRFTSSTLKCVSHTDHNVDNVAKNI